VKRKFKKVIVLLLPFIISLFCWVFVRDRSRIVGNYSLFRHQLPISQAFHAYRHIHNRFPLNIYEIIDDRIYWEFLRQDEVPSIQRPFLLPQPRYGIKTWLEDTLIYSAVYSYGLDYDDDSLNTVKYSVLRDKWMNTWEYAIYIIVPFCNNGDIIVDMWNYHVGDPRLDTTFVREIRELYGDTLSPKEYELWLKRREEYKNKRFW